MVGDLADREGSILYNGMGMRVDMNNVLAVPVLTGDVTTCSISPNGVTSV